MSTEDRIAQLETQIEGMEDQLADMRTQLAKAELDQWQGRIDDLEVQVHLAAMDTGDRLAPLVDELRNRWLDAQETLTSGPSTAGDVVDALRKGLEQAMKDIRSAVLDAKSAAGG